MPGASVPIVAPRRRPVVQVSWCRGGVYGQSVVGGRAMSTGVVRRANPGPRGVLALARRP